MKLRDYQQEAVELTEIQLGQGKSTLVVLPTGMGKTVYFSHLIFREIGSEKSNRHSTPNRTARASGQEAPVSDGGETRVRAGEQSGILFPELFSKPDSSSIYTELDKWS